MCKIQKKRKKSATTSQKKTKKKVDVGVGVGEKVASQRRKKGGTSLLEESLLGLGGEIFQALTFRRELRKRGGGTRKSEKSSKRKVQKESVEARIQLRVET